MDVTLFQLSAGESHLLLGLYFITRQVSHQHKYNNIRRETIGSLTQDFLKSNLRSHNDTGRALCFWLDLCQHFLQNFLWDISLNLGTLGTVTKSCFICFTLFCNKCIYRFRLWIFGLFIFTEHTLLKYINLKKLQNINIIFSTWISTVHGKYNLIQLSIDLHKNALSFNDNVFCGSV